MGDFILAIDQSTSATKALLFSSSGQVLDKVSLAHQQIYPLPGYVEHDAEEIYRNTIGAIQSLLERNPDRQKHIAGLSITNQRETVVVFDRQTGVPLYHAMVWQCRRGEPICSRLIAEGNEDWVRERTGLKIDTYFSAPKIAWLAEHQPDIHRKLVRGEALIGTMDAYLIYRLTRGKAFATDSTNASRTLLFDIDNLSWDEKLCKLFKVPISSLPEVRDSNALVGYTNIEGILNHDLPICGVMGDSQAALFAQRCFLPGNAKVTFGSGSSVLLNIGEQKVISPGAVTAVGWVLNGKPVYAFEGIINFTGATIAWLQNQLGLIQSPEETETVAMELEDNGGVYLVPAFVGLSAPYWCPNAKAMITGLTPHSNKKHIIRAALESIAYIVADVLNAMAKDAGVNLSQIHADGGAVKNRFLMQFVADMTRLKVKASNLPELSALGAALSGMLGLEIFRSLEDIQALPFSTTEYLPAMDISQAQTLYAGWKTAVNQVLGTDGK